MTCFECDAPAECMHHVVPRSRGGTKTVPLCERCHGLVHDVEISTKALTKQALARKRALGERIGSIPYGWRLAPDGVHLEEHHEEKSVVALVHHLHSADVSIRAIASHLEATGAPSRGSRWHATTVARLLKCSGG